MLVNNNYDPSQVVKENQRTIFSQKNDKVSAEKSLSVTSTYHVEFT